LKLKVKLQVKLNLKNCINNCNKELITNKTQYQQPNNELATIKTTNKSNAITAIRLNISDAIIEANASTEYINWIIIAIG